MLRAALTLGGTAVGLAALLMFKTQPGAPGAAAADTPATPSPATSATGAGASPAATATRSAGPKPSASTGGESASTTARIVTGSVVNTQYGPMQVQITLTGQKITNATVLQRTDDGTESDQIDAMAIPKLTSETLAAQSARIDAVSGASYTSSGYIQSLQSALDKAGA
jgi:uncharacterized protein with FMN-binding domain